MGVEPISKRLSFIFSSCSVCFAISTVLNRQTAVDIPYRILSVLLFGGNCLCSSVAASFELSGILRRYPESLTCPFQGGLSGSDCLSLSSSIELYFLQWRLLKLSPVQYQLHAYTMSCPLSKPGVALIIFCYIKIEH